MNGILQLLQRTYAALSLKTYFQVSFFFVLAILYTEMILYQFTSSHY